MVACLFDQERVRCYMLYCYIKSLTQQYAHIARWSISQIQDTHRVSPDSIFLLGGGLVQIFGHLGLADTQNQSGRVRDISCGK